MQIQTQKDSSNRLRITDPDLPMLATRAGLQIELIELGKNPNTDAIDEVLERLKVTINSAGDSEVEIPIKTDVSTLFTVNNILMKVQPEFKATTLYDIVAAAKDLTATKYHTGKDLVFLRNFFFALADFASSTTSSVNAEYIDTELRDIS